LKSPFLTLRTLFASVVACTVLPGACATPSTAHRPATVGTGTSTSAENRFVDSLLARMTLEEKLGQLNQVSGLGEPAGPNNTTARIQRGEIGSFLNVLGAETTRKVQRLAVDGSRMHIPLLFAMDVIHGYRTTFPVPLAEASSWDPAAAERATRVAAVEAAASGVHWTFAPMVDIARDPRWGRIVEGAGEDPYLGSAIAAARVRGFQGTDLRASNTIAATAKHFAGYGAAEGGRDYNVADLPERTMREIYLPPFHAAVCAGVQTFMSSFNEVAGIPAHANPHLTTDILRHEWGFDGMVVSDWTGVAELLNHGVGGDSATVGALAIQAGVDMDMVSEIFVHKLPALVKSGRLPEATVDEAVRRVLRLKYRLGLFEDPYRYSDTTRERTMILTAANRTAAREIARESIVLLKNTGNVLPLKKDLATIAVIGRLATDSGAVLGAWAGVGRSQDAVSVLDGIRRAVSPRTVVRYSRGASPESADTSAIAAAVSAARGANAVILVIGEGAGMSGEASSRASIELPGAQPQLVKAIAAVGVPVVAVLMNGRPLALESLHNSVPAILETWFLGTEHGNATADILFGDVSPAGKLPVTFPRVTGQVPIYYNHKNTGRPPDAQNHYSSKYIDEPWTPLYSFGHGLSYTQFNLSAPRLSAMTIRPTDTLRIDVDVTNTGAIAGDEIVQLYLRDDFASVTRPVQMLRGFRRIHLAPGERRTASFTLTARDMALFDRDLRLVVEPGTFTVQTGDSSDRTQSAGFRLDTPAGTSVAVADTCDPSR
jgi:beta-glucosidase